MPTIPLDPDPDRPASPEIPIRAASPTTAPPQKPSDSALPAPVLPSAPHDEISPAERVRLRDRRTGVIALVVITIALWACIAAAVGFATTM